MKATDLNPSKKKKKNFQRNAISGTFEPVNQPDGLFDSSLKYCVINVTIGKAEDIQSL